MKIIVLGSTGFVGKAVLSSPEAGTLRDEGVLFYHFSRTAGQDLMNSDKFTDDLAHIKPDVIINCAADVGSVHYVSANAADIVNNNTQMTLNLYNAVNEACPKAKIINPLANCAYPGDVNIQRESVLFSGLTHDSVFSYGNFKRYLYIISECYKRQYGIRSVNFIVPNAFGEGDSLDPNKTHAINGMVIRMLGAHRNGDKEFEVWGSGKPVREWIYVRDIASLLMEAINFDDDIPSLINMAQGQGHSISNSAHMIAEAIGYKGNIVFNTDYQDGAPVKIMDNIIFRSVFPDFEFYDHKRAIKNTVNYYEKAL